MSGETIAKHALAVARTAVAAFVAMFLLLAAAALVGCASGDGGTNAQAEIPKSKPSDDESGVDKNVNMATIDEYLGHEDVVYTDLRMLNDADSVAPCGSSVPIIDGFQVVPFPYIGDPEYGFVKDEYNGPALFDISWNGDGSIALATPNYEESMQILETLFPIDKLNFLANGNSSPDYAEMMRKLLIYFDWYPERIYNVGSAQEYTGNNSTQPADVTSGSSSGETACNIEVPPIDFSQLHPVD